MYMEMSRDWAIEGLHCLYPRGTRKQAVDTNNPGLDLAFRSMSNERLFRKYYEGCWVFEQCHARAGFRHF